MTKQPFDLPTWLTYLHTKVGVMRFYIKVEDTPELEPLLTSPPWSGRVHASFHTDTVRCWSGQTERQSMHVAHAIELARNDGLTHILHIDDDEV